MFRFLYAALLSLLPAIAPARADDIESLIGEAMKSNRELAAAEQKWRAKEAAIAGTRSLPDPMAGADVERFQSTGLSDWNDIEYMVQQDLPGPGKRGARKRVAELDAEAEGYRYLEVARSIRSRTTQAHWDLWLAERSVEVMTATRDLMGRMADSARARYESGSAMQSEALRLQLERSRMSNQVLTMAREVDVARSALNALLNAPPKTPRAVAKASPLPELTSNVEEMQAKARKFCCILLSFLKNVEAKEAAVRAARTERRPDFQVRAEARQFEESGRIDEYDTGVFMNIPWLWGGKYKAMIREAEADRAMAEAEYGDEVNRTMTEIQELHTMAESALRTLRLNADDLLPKARSLVDSLSAAYGTGQVPLVEFLDAQRAYLELQLETHRATADFAKNHAALMNVAAPWGPFEISTGLVTEEMNDE
jgi:outer membrane protein TolC